jgi:alkylation response protein AidB-like acyl-CoA dehydrogenase
MHPADVIPAWIDPKGDCVRMRATKRKRPMQERSPSMQASDCVTRARALAPLIAAEAARTEQTREISPAVLAALHEARLFRLLLPRSCDGLEVDPATFMQAMEELAKADGSTAWCVAQASGCAMSAAYVAPQVAREIFAPANAVMAWGPVGPDAKAVPVAGGWRASGTWSFASGIKHAGWLGCHCPLVEPDGTPRLGADGKPAERTMLIPKASARIDDVWRVVGLKGTGSDNYAIDDLLVPAEFTFTRESPDDRREQGPLYRFTTFHLYGTGFAAIALGLARASLDAFVELAATKVPKTKTFVLRDNAVVQSQVALAEAKLASSRCYLLDVLHDTWETAARGDPLALAQRAALKLAGTYSVHQAKDVVDTAYHAAGATAIFEDNPFERRFRDMHTVIQQVQAQFANFEMVGQVLLGLPSPSRLI